jgi:hypothetical protein
MTVDSLTDPSAGDHDAVGRKRNSRSIYGAILNRGTGYDQAFDWKYDTETYPTSPIPTVMIALEMVVPDWTTLRINE